MQDKVIKINNRHPNVVTIFEHEDDITGVSNILIDQFQDYRAISLNQEAVNLIEQVKPVVILFALSAIEKSIEFYASLVEKKIIDYPHHTVLLCANKESSIAFRCCMKGFFDNYFVYQPLYERYRLIMIVHKELQNMLSRNELYQFNESNFDKIDEDLAHIIDAGGTAKSVLLNKIKEQGELPINKKSNSKDAQSLSDLELGVGDELDQIISSLQATKDHYQQQAQRSKGLIYHQPRIKSRAEKMADIEAKSRESLASLDSAHKDEVKTKPDHIKPVNIPVDNTKLLVVEDNAIYRNVLVNILIKANFCVDQATDGLEALKKIKSGNYQLILMDLYMPKLDGLNATKKIKEISGGKDIPVIALTGNKSKENARKWIAHGLKGYIIKPSNKDEILAAVNKGLDAAMCATFN